MAVLSESIWGFFASSFTKIGLKYGCDVAAKWVDAQRGSAGVRMFERGQRRSNNSETHQLIEQARQTVAVSGTSLDVLLRPNAGLEAIVAQKLKKHVIFQFLTEVCT